MLMKIFSYAPYDMYKKTPISLQFINQRPPFWLDDPYLINKYYSHFIESQKVENPIVFGACGAVKKV